MQTFVCTMHASIWVSVSVLGVCMRLREYESNMRKYECASGPNASACTMHVHHACAPTTFQWQIMLYILQKKHVQIGKYVILAQSSRSRHSLWYISCGKISQRIASEFVRQMNSNTCSKIYGCMDLIVGVATCLVLFKQLYYALHRNQKMV